MDKHYDPPINEGRGWQNRQSTHTSLGFCFLKIPRHLFISSLVAHFSHQSLNRLSHGLADSCSTVTDVWLHTPLALNILFTHWQTFDLSKDIPPHCRFSGNSRSNTVWADAGLSKKNNYLVTMVEVTVTNYFVPVSITRGSTCYNKQPHFLSINMHHCLNDDGQIKKKVLPIKFIRCRNRGLSRRAALWPWWSSAPASVCGQQTTLPSTVGDYTTLWISLSVNTGSKTHFPGSFLYWSFYTVSFLGGDVKEWIDRIVDSVNP